MGRYADQKIYRTFEEFEREELRRDVAGSMNDLLDDEFAGELDFDAKSVRKSRQQDDDEEE
jgi:hypothetical protein